MSGRSAHFSWRIWPDGECMCPSPPPTERSGLAVGDHVWINDRWPAEVIGFNTLPDDVEVRWTGARPCLEGESTICRKGVKVCKAEDGAA